MWNPAQYEKFRDQRMQPFSDLVGMIQVRPGMRVVDLGCGTGELTAMLAERLPESTVEGIDSSAEMLAKASAQACPRVSFRQADISTFQDFSGYDLVFSHAAFQWVPDNESLMHRLLGSLKPGAQVAVQLPQNEAHPSHQIPEQMAQERPFKDLLGGYVRRTEALRMERYSQLLYEHGFTDQVCLEKIYGHLLGRTTDVVEWVKGTSLSAYLSRLDDMGRTAFLDTFTQRLIGEVGDQTPYFYPFRRLLFWGVKQ